VAHSFGWPVRWVPRTSGALARRAEHGLRSWSRCSFRTSPFIEPLSAGRTFHETIGVGFRPGLSVPASRQRDKPPHLFRNERLINRLLGFCKATTKSHYHKNAATFGTLERPQPASSGKRRDSFKCPRDIAVTAFALGIHGATPLIANAEHYGEPFTSVLSSGAVVFRGCRISCAHIKAPDAQGNTREPTARPRGARVRCSRSMGARGAALTGGALSRPPHRA